MTKHLSSNIKNQSVSTTLQNIDNFIRHGTFAKQLICFLFDKQVDQDATWKHLSQINCYISGRREGVSVS